MAKAKDTNEYILRAEDFAKPILKEIRSRVHEACPDCEETIKWLFPHFQYKGNMCSMAAFNEHCAFTFWKGEIMADPDKILQKVGKSAMGQLGQIKSLKDLPSKKIMRKYIKEAMRLNDEDIKLPKKPKLNKKDIEVSDSFNAILKKNKKAKATFDNFSPSNQRDYVEWFVEAKTEATKNKRMATAIEWLSEGKPRNWKYMKKYR